MPIRSSRLPSRIERWHRILALFCPLTSSLLAPEPLPWWRAVTAQTVPRGSLVPPKSDPSGRCHPARNSCARVPTDSWLGQLANWAVATRGKGCAASARSMGPCVRTQWGGSLPTSWQRRNVRARVHGGHWPRATCGMRCRSSPTPPALLRARWAHAGVSLWITHCRVLPSPN